MPKKMNGFARLTNRAAPLTRCGRPPILGIPIETRATSEKFEQLKTLDGARLAGYLAGHDEFHRAFPLFFRAVGEAVTAQLVARFPGIEAHVGEDYRREAIARIGSLLPPLHWVAFSFPGYSMWDLHVGCVARLDVWPAQCQVGVHWMAPVAETIEPLVRAVNWATAVGTAGELAESPAVAEIQQRDLAQPLDTMNLAGEAERLAGRAIRYYTVVRPLVDALPERQEIPWPRPRHR